MFTNTEGGEGVEKTGNLQKKDYPVGQARLYILYTMCVLPPAQSAG